MISAAPSLSCSGPTISDTIKNIDFEELEKTQKEFDDFVELIENMAANTIYSPNRLHQGSPV